MEEFELIVALLAVVIGLDWLAGRFPLPYHDGSEFVPLPPDTRAPRLPNPLS